MKQPFCAPAEALRRVLDAAAQLPKPAVENAGLDEAVGRIAAAPLCARMDQPPFDRSPLDGYALHSADTADANATFPMDGCRLADRMALMYRIGYRSQQRSSRSS